VHRETLSTECRTAVISSRSAYTAKFISLLQVFRAVFLMVFVAHLLACFFYMNIPEQLENNVPVESTWIGAYDPELLDFEKSDNTKRYVAAFYWAVITISTVARCLLLAPFELPSVNRRTITIDVVFTGAGGLR